MKKLLNSELERKSPEAFRSSEKLPIVVVLDNVRSGYNVGSVFRTCDAFPVEAIYICGISAFPPHKEILKTSLGAEKTVEWKYFKTTVEAVNELKENGYKIFAIEQADGSIALNEISNLIPNAFRTQISNLAIVFGHEVDGVHQNIMDLCDGCIEIPQGGTKHSLNIAVSAGAVLWEFFRGTLKAK